MGQHAGVPNRNALLRLDERGLHCAAGGFHVDPWAPVPVAVITHGHADHCRPGSGVYLVTEDGVGVVRKRLGDVAIEIVGYGERRSIGDVMLSLHPAGHVLGSAQVLVQAGGERTLFTGDFKRQADPTCLPFESVLADHLITEATFALPIYRWPDPMQVIDALIAIHREAEDRTTVVYAYALGKAQRLLALLASRGIEGVHVHGAIAAMNAVYREAGIVLPETPLVIEASRGKKLRGALVLAPLAARGTPFMRRFTDPVEVLASGFMQVRGNRRRRSLDHGLVISDHADWPALIDTVKESGAQHIQVTHGYTVPFAQTLREMHGLDASPLEAHAWTGESGAEENAPPTPTETSPTETVPFEGKP